MRLLERDARLLVRRRANNSCEVCGGPGYQFSHRRTRSVRDEHQWCPCNGLLACQTCHSVMHRNPENARAWGHHVSSFVDLPGEVPVHLLGRWWMVRCDGSYSWAPDKHVSLIDGTPTLAPGY